MTHDPLCVQPQVDYPCARCWEIDCECLCICDIIAKVREDEREKADGQSVILASECEKQIAKVRWDERIAAEERVSGILHWSQDDDGLVCNWNRAVEAARGEQP